MSTEIAPALVRGLQIVDLLADSSQPLSLTQISLRLGFAKSTTSNLCGVLEGARLIQRRPGGFTLGRKAVELGGRYLASFDQLREFYSRAAEMPQLSKELVKVAMLDGTDVLYLARLEGRAPLRLSASVGDRFPAASTSVGNILLSLLSNDEISRRFQSPDAFPRWTGLSTRNLEDLRAKLALARERGYAAEQGAVLPGVNSWAVALEPARGGDPPLALGVSYVAETTSQQDAEVLLAELRELQELLGNPSRVLDPGAPVTAAVL